MNCHQILSGACNAGDRCYAVGSVEGISFTVSLNVPCYQFYYLRINVYLQLQTIFKSFRIFRTRKKIIYKLQTLSDLTYMYFIYC